MKNSVRDFKTKSHGLMVAFSILISGSFILGSFVANAIDPSAISALRFFLAFLILAFVIKLNNLGKGLLLKKMWRYIILGGLVSLYFVLMFEGLKTASPIAMSAIMTMTPFLASVLEYFIYKRRTDLIIFVALLIGAFGSVWIIFDADFKKIIYFNIGHGETLFLFGCAAQALYTILVKTLNEGESALEQTSNTMLVSAILLVIIDFKEIINTNWFSLSSLVWLSIAYLSVFATAVAFFIIQFSRNYLPSTYVMAYYYIVPMWVMLFEIVVLGTVVPLQLWIGCIAIICTFIIILIKDIKYSKN